jgi:hypothetical protein
MKPKTKQFIRFPRDLLESPAYRALNLPERKALDRIMVEYHCKSGFQNNGLPVTRRNFVEFGVNPKHVTSSVTVLRTLDIIECVSNWGGSKSGRRPNLFRLPFLPSTPTGNDDDHRYLKITKEQAKEIAHRHRHHDNRDRAAPKRQKKPKLRVLSPATAPLGATS